MATSRGYDTVPGTTAPDVPFYMNRALGQINDDVESVAEDLANLPPVTWANVSGKPATFPPATHGHSAEQVTFGGGSVKNTLDEYAGHINSLGTRVTDAQNTANTARTEEIPSYRVTGSARAWNATSGTSSTWASVNVDSNGFFFRFTSSRRYKENIRPAEVDPARVYGMEPVRFERLDSGRTEVGFIAEELVDLGMEDFVYWERDAEGLMVPGGIHYEMLPVALVAAVKDLHARTTELEAMEARLSAVEGTLAAVIAALELSEEQAGGTV